MIGKLLFFPPYREKPKKRWSALLARVKGGKILDVVQQEVDTEEEAKAWVEGQEGG